ncbi:MAG: hypothetical protein NTZ17_06785 [Phycisphaerae bacterium]|nr:hypothetical protein [Phycisphaerae bacterium]
MGQHFSWRSYLGVVVCLMAALAVCTWAGEANAPASKPAAVAEVSVDAAKIREPISPYIYGQFIEHLGRCIYGGIWAEMLEDRKFYFPVPADQDIWRLTREQARVLAASPWKVIGPQGTVEMVKQDAFVATSLCRSMRQATELSWVSIRKSLGWSRAGRMWDISMWPGTAKWRP